MQDPCTVPCRQSFRDAPRVPRAQTCDKGHEAQTFEQAKGGRPCIRPAALRSRLALASRSWRRPSGAIRSCARCRSRREKMTCDAAAKATAELHHPEIRAVRGQASQAARAECHCSPVVARGTTNCDNWVAHVPRLRCQLSVATLTAAPTELLLLLLLLLQRSAPRARGT